MTGSARQSNKADDTARLIKLFNKLPENHQQAVLNMLEDWLDWIRASRRKHPRKPCFMAVDYGTTDRAFRGFIRDISTGGVFIETHMTLPVAQEVILTFSSSKYKTPIKVTGKIAWRGPHGIGVKFKTEDQHLEPMIKSL